MLVAALLIISKNQKLTYASPGKWEAVAHASSEVVFSGDHKATTDWYNHLSIPATLMYPWDDTMSRDLQLC